MIPSILGHILCKIKPENVKKHSIHWGGIFDLEGRIVRADELAAEPGNEGSQELMGPGKNAMSGGGEGTGKKKKSSSQRQVKMVRLMTTAPSGTMEEAKNRGSVHDATV
jgi:hypothetical protein